jgi:hypothetical protein
MPAGHHIRSLLRHGWRVLTEVHTVVWIATDLLGIAVVPTALGFWIWIQGVHLSIVIAIATMVLGVCFLCLLGLLGHRDEQRLPIKTHSAPDRNYVDVKPSHLVAFFKSHTAIQAAGMVAVYTGSWMRRSGSVDNVMKNGPTRWQLTFRTFGQEPVFMYFVGKRWATRLATLRPRDKVIVDGRIREVDTLAVHLEDCEFVDVAGHVGSLTVVDDDHPATKEADTKERIFVGEGITPEYLLSFFQQHTSVQAKNATKDYVGKWMKVSGQVGNVLSTYQDFAQVTFERQKSSPVEWVDYITVYMYFRGSWKDRAIILKRGDTITTIGQIREIEAVDLHLDNCEFDDSPSKG